MFEVFLIHGAKGSPGENWFPWMKLNLENMGFKVFTPQFSTPEGQSLENWLKEFKKYEKYIDSNTVLVGHSVGAAFLLRWLEKSSVQVAACMLVAGFTHPLGNELDSLNSSFLQMPFDWEKIRKKSKVFYVYYSDNDPYVPQREGRNIAGKLGCEGLLIRGAGHFNSSSGYTEFPELLNQIYKECKKITGRKS